jgi:hypothetical protein
MKRRNFLSMFLGCVTGLLGLSQAEAEEEPILGERPFDVLRWQNGQWEEADYEALRVGDLVQLCEEGGAWTTRTVTDANPNYVAFSRRCAGINGTILETKGEWERPS